jgi:lipopolysaccharide export system permease protein
MIVQNGLAVSGFMKLSMLIIPQLAWVCLPISCFIASMFVYSRLYNDSELVIFSSSGFSKIKILKPAITLGVIASLICLYLAMDLMPRSMQSYGDIRNIAKQKTTSNLLLSGTFSNFKDGITVYVGKKNLDTLEDIMIDDRRDSRNPATYIAKKAEVSNSGSYINANLYDGIKLGETSTLAFEKYSLQIAGIDKILSKRTLRIKEMFMQQLIKEKHYKELFHRLTWLLMPIILAIMGAMPLVSGEFSRHGKNQAVIKTTALAILITASVLILKANSIYWLQMLFAAITLIGVIIISV